MDVREKTSGKTGRHHWNKEPKLKTAAISEEEEDNHGQHQRVALRTAITSGKRRNSLQDPI
jgi:hypothetical protein